jgi:regulator of sigma E protease
MLHILTTWILPLVIVLGAAVTLHEFGHFLVAKILKIRVETFSFGFGPRLIGRKWGQTDYRISAIPLGGYVKLGGDESNAPIEGDGAPDIPACERFDLRPRWQRIAVAVAGPVMNILTALAIPFGAGLIYGVPATPAPIVASVLSDSAAQEAGLQPGDRIVSFNGYANPDWDTMSDDALLSPNKPLPIIVQRNGQQLQLTIKPKAFTRDGETAGELGFIPDYGNVTVFISEVVSGTGAETAGLKPEDKIVAIGGEPVKSSEQIVQYIRSHKDQPIEMDVDRGGQRTHVTAQVAQGQQLLGVKVGQRLPPGPGGPVAAFGYAVNQNVRILKLTAKALGQVFSGERSVRNTISGPIGIARESSRAVTDAGWSGLFVMIGFLSLNLGIFNLLPIPVLDGGAIFLLLIEGVLAIVGLSISTRVRERIQQVGFVFVILLMVFVLTNDALKQFSLGRGSDSNPPANATPAK